MSIHTSTSVCYTGICIVPTVYCAILAVAKTPICQFSLIRMKKVGLCVETHVCYNCPLYSGSQQQSLMTTVQLLLTIVVNRFMAISFMNDYWTLVYTCTLTLYTAKLLICNCSLTS